MERTPRVFEDKPATRERTPLLVGICGPSSSGKTFSALRIASGIRRVVGGEIHVIDTEMKRALHYTNAFRLPNGEPGFRHVPFAAPFSPLDYLDAIRHSVGRGAKTIVIDSMSLEHEGQGGVLEMHEAEVDRMAGDDYGKRERVKMLAWGKPKAARRRLLQAMTQIDCNFVLCFRAKEKLKIVKGKDPEALGWMPIAGPEFVYEMVLKLLLLPGSDGVPVTKSEFEGERGMIKIPMQFRDLFTGDQKQISEDLGERLATWAAGDLPIDVAALLAAYTDCADAATLRVLEADRTRVWSKLPPNERKKFEAPVKAAQKRVAESVPVTTTESTEASE